MAISGHIVTLQDGGNGRHVVDVTRHYLESEQALYCRHERWHIDRQQYTGHDAEEDTKPADHGALNERTP